MTACKFDASVPRDIEYRMARTDWRYELLLRDVERVEKLVDAHCHLHTAYQAVCSALESWSTEAGLVKEGIKNLDLMLDRAGYIDPGEPLPADDHPNYCLNEMLRSRIETY